MEDTPSVSGVITFEAGAPPFSGATLYVYLENVTTADAAAEIVARHVARNVTQDARAVPNLKFVLTPITIDPRADYAVRIHIDLDGDAMISAGDYISTQTYPVLTFGRPRHVSIRVQQVR